MFSSNLSAFTLQSLLILIYSFEAYGIPEIMLSFGNTEEIMEADKTMGKAKTERENGIFRI